MTIPLPDEDYALCKKHPWLLYKIGGKHFAHRKEVRRVNKDGIEVVRDATTVQFTADNEDMTPQTRLLFAQTIKEMEVGLT